MTSWPGRHGLSRTRRVLFFLPMDCYIPRARSRSGARRESAATIIIGSTRFVTARPGPGASMPVTVITQRLAEYRRAVTLPGRACRAEMAMISFQVYSNVHPTFATMMRHVKPRRGHAITSESHCDTDP